MAAAEVATGAHEVNNSLQRGYVHRAAPASDHASAMPRTLPQSISLTMNENVDISPASSKSKHSTQVSTSDASQSTNAGQKEWSPPSTAVSSQEQLPIKELCVAAESSGTALHNAAAQGTSQSTSCGAWTGSPSRPDASLDMIKERKRTSSGQSKRASISSLHDLETESTSARSRPSTALSTTSNGTVMELSQQLRTRLTYAMVKVQNGWQTRSLDEVESLASQSPRSTVSGFPRNPLRSPRSVTSGNLQRSWSSSGSSDDAPVPSLQNLAYDSTMQAPQQPRHGLAPPADIVPGSRRKPSPNTKGYGQGLITSSSQNPRPVRPAPKLRTPSQTAAQEADAVETLLFMASPGNSGSAHHPPNFTPVESSLRSAYLVSSQLSPVQDHLDHSGHFLSPKKVSLGTGSTAKDRLTTRTVQIERMLDESDDDNDDYELDRALQVAAMTHATGPLL